MALRQQARRALLAARIAQSSRQRALAGERGGRCFEQGRHSSSGSGSKDDEPSWGLKMFKG
jgi:hypothetical protein